MELAESLVLWVVAFVMIAGAAGATQHPLYAGPAAVATCNLERDWRGRSPERATSWSCKSERNSASSAHTASYCLNGTDIASSVPIRLGRRF